MATIERNVLIERSDSTQRVIYKKDSMDRLGDDLTEESAAILDIQ